MYYFDKKDYPRAKEMLAKYEEVGKDQNHLNSAKDILAIIATKK